MAHLLLLARLLLLAVVAADFLPATVLLAALAVAVAVLMALEALEIPQAQVRHREAQGVMVRLFQVTVLVAAAARLP
jgi:hypothetical protein